MVTFLKTSGLFQPPPVSDRVNSQLTACTHTDSIVPVYSVQLCLKVALIRLESPEKVFPNIIWPAIDILVLYGYCVEIDWWIRAALPELRVFCAWINLWKYISFLIQSQPTLSRSFFLDHHLLRNQHTVLAAGNCWTCKLYHLSLYFYEESWQIPCLCGH